MSMSFHQLDLRAMDGANPLGFLAALGTLAVLAEAGAMVKLGWRRAAHWTPFLQRERPLSEGAIARLLAKKMRGNPVDPAAEKQCAAAHKALVSAKKDLKDAQKKLKQRRLRGKEREAAWKAEIEPRIQQFDATRKKYLGALKSATPSLELAIGDRPDCTINEFREHAYSAMADAGPTQRLVPDLLAAFGSECEANGGQHIAPTPFCFITGSGHQWFLKTARDLMAKTSAAKLFEATFKPWTFSDPGLSMRWNPTEDIRYALQLDDPGPIGAHTVWMANLLAYRALAFFPCVPARHGMAAAGWSGHRQLNAFTWPIWEAPLGMDTIRSLLCHIAFGNPEPIRWRMELRARGVVAIFRSQRIAVGSGGNRKINFSPAQSL